MNFQIRPHPNKHQPYCVSRLNQDHARKLGLNVGVYDLTDNAFLQIGGYVSKFSRKFWRICTGSKQPPTPETPPPSKFGQFSEIIDTGAHEEVTENEECFNDLEKGQVWLLQAYVII